MMEHYADDSDRATAIEELERERVLSDRERIRQAEAELARQRVESGIRKVFCEDCDTIIPPERLEAVPHAVLCVWCQSASELIDRRYL